MEKIVDTKKAFNIAKRLQNKGKKIVVAGGCFDVLHVGHIDFLKASKEKGDVLFILLESDETVRKIKGGERPINSQVDRAKLLSSLTNVDYVIPLPPIETNQGYDELIFSLKPAIITTTRGDATRNHKDRQARQIGAQVVEVISRIENKSTSSIARLLEKDI